MKALGLLIAAEAARVRRDRTKVARTLGACSQRDLDLAAADLGRCLGRLATLMAERFMVSQ